MYSILLHRMIRIDLICILKRKTVVNCGRKRKSFPSRCQKSPVYLLFQSCCPAIAKPGILLRHPFPILPGITGERPEIHFLFTIFIKAPPAKNRHVRMKRKKKRKVTPSHSWKRKNLVPGTVVYTGEKEDTGTEIEVIDYSKNHFHREVSVAVSDLASCDQTESPRWINIKGLSNAEDIMKLGKQFHLHPLNQENIADIHQRPKLEEFEDFLFMVLKIIYYDPERGLRIEHLSLILRRNCVLTFHESENDIFRELKQRLQQSQGRIRTSGADYLMFAILDTIFDNYFTAIEHIVEKLEDIEDVLFDNQTDPEVTNRIHELRKDILSIRKVISPTREVVNRLEKTESGLIESGTRKYLKDLYDHILQINENIETYREMTRSLMEMFMSGLSNKMNEVMKVLTIMASIFIPLTFLAGIYGMNFDYMPELHYRYAYFILLILMMLIILLMVWYFKRKKWF